MCDVKLVKLREIDVKKYVFKRALKEAAIKNTTQNLEDCRMDKIQELNNVLMLKKFWSVEFEVVLNESEEDDSEQSNPRKQERRRSSCKYCKVEEEKVKKIMDKIMDSEKNLDFQIIRERNDQEYHSDHSTSSKIAQRSSMINNLITIPKLYCMSTNFR